LYQALLRDGRSDDRGSVPGDGWEFFSSIGSGAHAAAYSMGTAGSFPGKGVKLPEHETDNSPPSIAVVKEYVEMYLHSANAYSRLGAHLTRGQFYLYFYHWTEP